MDYDFPWCLHKHEERHAEITRMKDWFRVWLQECNGIRTEEWTW